MPFTVSKALSRMRHHRVSLLDAGLFAGTIIAAGVIAFEYDFSGTLPQDKRIEFQEAIALGIVVIFGIVYFGWRRVIDTSLASPEDICDPGREEPFGSGEYRVSGHSVVVLTRGPG